MTKLSIGQLLDWLGDLRTAIEKQPNSEQAKQIVASLIEGEVRLSSWRTALKREHAVQNDHLLTCQVAAAQGNVQEFVRAAGALDTSKLAPAGRYALSFDRRWQQILALEEVVLAGEVATVGFKEAARRRASFSEAKLYALEHRLAAVIPNK